MHEEATGWRYEGSHTCAMLPASTSTSCPAAGASASWPAPLTVIGSSSEMLPKGSMRDAVGFRAWLAGLRLAVARSASSSATEGSACKHFVPRHELHTLLTSILAALTDQHQLESLP